MRDLYFKFVGGGGYIFDTRSFYFQRITPGIKQNGSLFSASDFDLESAPASFPIVIKNEVVESITDDSWVAYRGFDFGSHANLLAIQGATPGAGGMVEIRLDSSKGLIVGTVDVCHTGSWVHYRPFSGAFAKPVSGLQAST